MTNLISDEFLLIKMRVVRFYTFLATRYECSYSIKLDIRETIRYSKVFCTAIELLKTFPFKKLSKCLKTMVISW